mgnify:CR=1 FL=1
MNGKMAMDYEMQGLMENGTWNMGFSIKRKEVKPIGSQWVYKVKYHFYGSISTHKARLASKGYAKNMG